METTSSKGLLQATDRDCEEPISGAVELEALGEGAQARGERGGENVFGSCDAVATKIYIAK